MDSLTSNTAILQKQSLEELQRILLVLMKAAGRKFGSVFWITKMLFYSADVLGCFCHEA